MMPRCHKVNNRILATEENIIDQSSPTHRRPKILVLRVTLTLVEFFNVSIRNAPQNFGQLPLQLTFR